MQLPRTWHGTAASVGASHTPESLVAPPGKQVHFLKQLGASAQSLVQRRSDEEEEDPEYLKARALHYLRSCMLGEVQMSVWCSGRATRRKIVMVTEVASLAAASLAQDAELVCSPQRHTSVAALPFGNGEPLLSSKHCYKQAALLVIH